MNAEQTEAKILDTLDSAKGDKAGRVMIYQLEREVLCDVIRIAHAAGRLDYMHKAAREAAETHDRMMKLLEPKA